MARLLFSTGKALEMISLTTEGEKEPFIERAWLTDDLFNASTACESFPDVDTWVSAMLKGGALEAIGNERYLTPFTEPSANARKHQ